MAPQRLEKIESAPGNGMGSEASNLLDLVHGRAATVRELRLASREDELQKKAPNTLKSLYAELKLSLALRTLRRGRIRADQLLVLQLRPEVRRYPMVEGVQIHRDLGARNGAGNDRGDDGMAERKL